MKVHGKSWIRSGLWIVLGSVEPQELSNKTLRSPKYEIPDAFDDEDFINQKKRTVVGIPLESLPNKRKTRADLG